MLARFAWQRAGVPEPGTHSMALCWAGEDASPGWTLPPGRFIYSAAAGLVAEPNGPHDSDLTALDAVQQTHADPSVVAVGSCRGPGRRGSATVCGLHASGRARRLSEREIPDRIPRRSLTESADGQKRCDGCGVQLE